MSRSLLGNPFAVGYMKQYGEKGDSTWIKEEQYSCRPTWKQLLEEAKKSYRWLTNDETTNRYFFTTTNSRLVAIACGDQDGSGDRYAVVTNTKPQTTASNRLEATGRQRAPEWYAASHTPPSNGTALNMEYHVEDLTFAIMEILLGFLGRLPRDVEPVRILVYGIHPGQSEPQLQYLCDRRMGSRKNPSCTGMGTTVRARFPHETMTLQMLEEQDRMKIPEHIYYKDYLQKQAAQAAAQQQQQQQQGGQRPTTSGSGSSKISSGSYLDDVEYDPKTGKLITNEGASRHSSQERGVRSARHAAGGESSYGISDLTRGMDALRMGGGGRPSRSERGEVRRSEGRGYAPSTPQYDSRSERRSDGREYSSRSEGRGYSSSTAQYSSRSDDRGYSSRSDDRKYPSSQSADRVVYSSRSERPRDSRDSRDTAGRRVVRYYE